MRLINADKITKVLEELLSHSLDGKMNIESALYLISIQNTSYDVDKVVEELLNNSIETVSGLDIIELQKAIEIVKAGVKNE